MYGKRARIGCIIPSTNTVVEPEFNAMRPDGVSVHVDRILMRRVTPSELRSLACRVTRPAARLATARVSVILFACTSGSFLDGVEAERALVARMEDAAGVRSITTSGAVIAALNALGARRIVLATPYTDSINEREVSFFESQGFEVIRSRGLQKVVNTDIGRLGPDESYRIALEVMHPRAEAIFISCTDFRTLENLSRIEQEKRIPVVSSNQASFWHCLRTAGVKDAIPGFGRLFQI